MATIKVAADGPFLLAGLDGVTRAADGKVFAVDGACALCRCGGSKNKPFCDGSHASNGFSGARDPDALPDRRDDYVGEAVTIHDNRSLCAHAGYCTDALKEVFKLGQEPWIDPDGAAKEEIIKAVENCPSGALSYSIDPSSASGPLDDARGRQAPEPSIAFAPNGPYVCRGGCELEDAEFPKGGTKDHFTLCRCGQSTVKPFCSGAHWNVEFDDDA